MSAETEILIRADAWQRAIEARDSEGCRGVPRRRLVVHRVVMTAVVAGADRSGLFVLLDLWIDEARAWRVWRRHPTRSPPARCHGPT